MTRALTNDDFMARMEILHPTLKILGKYSRSNRRVEVQCKVCLNIYSPMANQLLVKPSNCKECWRKRVTKHNLYYHPLYTVRQSLLQRIKTSKYKNKGYVMCDRWSNDQDGVTNFVNDLEDAYEAFIEERNTTPHLCRIDPRCRVYSPENCQFKSPHEARLTKINITPVKIKGEVVSESEASRRLGYNRTYLKNCRVTGQDISFLGVEYV